MQKILATMILFLISGTLPTEARSQSQRDAEASLNKIRVAVESGEVFKLRVLYMPYEIVTAVATTPSSLESTAPKVFDIDLFPKLKYSLIRALSSTTLSKASDPEPEVRLGIIFFNRNGNKIHSIFIGRWYRNTIGRMGYVDERVVNMNSALGDWVDQNFCDCSLR